MNNAARFTIVAAAAFVVGGLAGYTYFETRPITVTSTDVSVAVPSGPQALGHARDGMAALDAAVKDIDKGSLDQAAAGLAKAKTQFASLAKEAGDQPQPIPVAQEAIIVHQFTPSKLNEMVGTAGKDTGSSADMAITAGGKTRPLALDDYSLSFGDVNVATDAAAQHIDNAIAAAKDGKKDLARKEILAARGAVTVAFSGDAVGG